MTPEQLEFIKNTVENVCRLETSIDPNYDIIEKICDDGISYINENRVDIDVDNYIYKFLEDCDIRKKDTEYGNYQRAVVTDLLNHLDHDTTDKGN